MIMLVFRPKIIDVLKEGYNSKTFFKDLTSGLTVSIVALPLALAIAIASGAKPEQGLYTAIIAGFLISLFSGSRFQIGGPTGAFIVLVYHVIQQYGYDGLAKATLMAGIILIFIGVFRIGTWIKYIPYPVTIGFTSGIAVVIMSSQLKFLLGIQVPHASAHFVGQIREILTLYSHVNYYDIGIVLGCFAILKFWPKVTRRVPGMLIVISASTLVVSLFHFPVETIGSKFGTVANTFVPPQFTFFSSRSEFVHLLSPAFAIALLAGIESLLSAVVADGMTGRRHRSNTELIAQGIANIVSVLFSGIPATGAIARTATNIRSGGLTPFAGMFHAFFLLIIMLLFAQYAALVPLCALAAILIMVAFHMGEWKLFLLIAKSPAADLAVLLTTFLLTVFVDLAKAIEFGMILASLLFMHRLASASRTTSITNVLRDENESKETLDIISKKIPAGVEVYEIQGSLFFGAADQFKETLSRINQKPKVLILRMRQVVTIDATSLRALQDILKQTKKEKTHLLFSGLHKDVFIAMKRFGLVSLVGEKNFFKHIDHALLYSETLL
ncbi:MAG: STAS domain-containing protein [Deltaproteobacteria bacterium]|nr:STAS domain-containing protein [Deltaproteobacteria bacterium]